MNYDLTTNNKRFINFYKQLESNGFYDPLKILELNDKSLFKTSPYSKRLDVNQQGKILKECCINPWYVLREVIRTQVGTTKRFIDISPGELLALINFLEGGRTFVSAGRYTIKTNLLVLSMLMTLPKVVLYSSDIKGAAFVSSIKRRYREILEPLPQFLYDFYMNNFPEFISLSKVKMRNGIKVPGFKNSEVIIIQDNYEYDPWSNSKNLRKLEDNRLMSEEPIKHILVSSINDDLDASTKSYLEGIDYIETNNIANPELNIRASSKMVPVKLETIKRLSSDRARSKYYKNIILKGYEIPLSDSLFDTR